LKRYLKILKERENHAHLKKILQDAQPTELKKPSQLRRKRHKTIKGKSRKRTRGGTQSFPYQNFGKFYTKGRIQFFSKKGSKREGVTTRDGKAVWLVTEMVLHGLEGGIEKGREGLCNTIQLRRIKNLREDQ